MTGLDRALRGLRAALDSPSRQQTWCWLVRHRLAAVRTALVALPLGDPQAGLAAREQSLARSRSELLARLDALDDLLREATPDRVRSEVRRVVHEIEHHRQRLHDLAYDGVSQELGGSE